MNWIAYNVGTDVTLPGRHLPTPFLLLPQFEPAQGSAENGNSAVQYAISARRVEL